MLLLYTILEQVECFFLDKKCKSHSWGLLSFLNILPLELPLLLIFLSLGLGTSLILEIPIIGSPHSWTSCHCDFHHSWTPYHSDSFCSGTTNYCDHSKKYLYVQSQELYYGTLQILDQPSLTNSAQHWLLPTPPPPLLDPLLSEVRPLPLPPSPDTLRSRMTCVSALQLRGSKMQMAAFL